MLVSPRLVSPRLGHVGRRNGRALEQWDTWKGTCYLLRTSVVLQVAPECRQFYRRRYPTRLTLDPRGRQRCSSPLPRLSSATRQGQLDPRRALLELPVQQQELRSGVVRALWNRFTTRVPFTLPWLRWISLHLFSDDKRRPQVCLPNHYQMDMELIQPTQMDFRFMLLLRTSGFSIFTFGLPFAACSTAVENTSSFTCATLVLS